MAALPPPLTPRAFSCRCGRPIFFRNSQCLNCGRPLGYDPAQRQLIAIESVDASDRWRESGAATDAPTFRRCRHLDTAAACNWLVAADDPHAGVPPMCRSCRLTRTLPDVSVAENALWWHRIELAKRRLVSSLLGLGLPVAARIADDPQRGLAFDLLRRQPGGRPILTGHVDGVITLDIEEADDATREQRRSTLFEPYRTLLGHLRHECGHYYWYLLVGETDWLQPWRRCFGDERADYAGALQHHYEDGPPADWRASFVSAYAGSHPWEDWAETWAHYLHMVDTLDTARSFGLDSARVELLVDRFDVSLLGHVDDTADAAVFMQFVNAWVELTGVLNELSRSMGVPDYYPFVLSAPAVRKLHFVHRVVKLASAIGAGSAVPASGGASVPATEVMMVNG